MKLRVCLIIPTLDRGGAEKQIALLAKGLNQEGIEPIVVVLTHTGPWESELLDAGIQIHHINKRLKLDPFAWWRLRQLLSRIKPDIVHSWLFAANAYGRSAALSAGIPIILGSERSVDPWKNGMQFWIDKLLANRTHGITANSQGTIDFYAQHGIAKEHFNLIPNGIEPLSPTKIDRAEFLSRLGLTTDKKVILSVGRLWPQKGYKDLIWAAELLRIMREDIAYVIIGEGPERQRLEEYRDNIKGATNVHLVGQRTDISDLLPHCELLWNGSLYEGQSNVILEAMQAGVAVVASDIPGNRELIQSGETGVLYPLGEIDQLTRTTNLLLNDSEYRKRLGTNAQMHIQKQHSVHTMVARHAELYRAKAAKK
jgi:glycosyltransferase involved in cell wall biosynthesis